MRKKIASSRKRRRYARGRRMTKAQLLEQRERHKFWRWSEYFDKAAALALAHPSKGSPVQIAHRAAKLADELCKAAEKRRPKSDED